MTKSAIAAGLVVVLAARAAADPLPLPQGHVRLNFGPGILETYTGQKYVLPLGTHILTYETWEMLDTETRRLQEQEVRLTAENKSLRKSADSWRPGWKIVAAGVLLGVAGGIYVGMKY
jgi:hypothetical protein